MKREFYLLVDSCLCGCYAVSRWIEEFDKKGQFKGILVREDRPSEAILKQRNEFHKKYANHKELTDEMCRELARLYGSFDETEKAMINLFGVPKYSTTHDSDTVFLGRNINGELAKNWLTKTCHDYQPFIFTHIGQIFKPWWLEITGDRLLNVHSAVLPYARGIYSIENVAALKDIDQFKKATGITIHFIDQGVDTGPIIRTERIINPFRFNSIWELKGYTYMLGYNLYIETAQRIIFSTETIPVGTVGDPNLRGPNFRTKDWTEEQKHRSEQGYLSMKKSVARLD